MIWVFLGFAILIVSFLIALLTLIRDQREQEKEQESLNLQQPQEQNHPAEKTEVSYVSNRVENPLENNQESGGSENEFNAGEVSSSSSSLLKGGEFIIPRGGGDRK